jgi:glycosyltransferase involved in cell wall biosynthesis
LKILMLLDDGFPLPNTEFYDIRVAKEARTLIKAGHRLSLLTSGVSHRPRKEIIDDINVIRTEERPTKINARLAWETLWFSLTFIDTFWKKALVEAVKQENPQVIHVHDLTLVPTAVPVARDFNLPLVADLHENYPEGMRFWRKGWKGRALNLINPIWRWKQMEKNCLKRVARVVTVVDEGKEHYVKDCQVPPEKITVVMNVEDDYYASLPVDEAIVKRYEPYFTISYIGGFGYHRGLHTAIQAMPEILREVDNARLLLIGTGENFTEMKAMAKKLGVDKSVDFAGRQPFDSVPSYVAASDICLVPHVASGHTDSTIPHKLFQYMAKTRPVIVSSAKPLARIVKETGTGLVFQSEDASDLAKAVLKIHGDSRLAEELGKAGEKAVKERYNWQKEGMNLVKMYQNLGAGE